MLVGCGVDAVSISRLRRRICAQPQLLNRLFAPAELAALGPVVFPGAPQQWRRLATRMAAKEAALKTLGGLPPGGTWKQLQTIGFPGCPPRFSAVGACALAAARREIGRWHMSLSHEGDLALATIIGEKTGEKIEECGPAALAPGFTFSASAAITENLGFHLASQLWSGDLLLLEGELGAGKTGFTRGLAAGLGLSGVSSPTFVLHRRHELPQGFFSVVPRGNTQPIRALNHVDAYRLDGEAAATPAGREAFAALDLELEGAITVVEWPRDYADIFPSALKITFHQGPQRLHSGVDIPELSEPRILEFSPRGPAWSPERFASLGEYITGHISGYERGHGAGAAH